MVNNFDEKLINEYDALMNAWPHADRFRSYGASLIEHYISTNPLPSKHVVFEIGCGKGELTKKLLDINPKVYVIAAELNPVMIDFAQEQLIPYRDRCTIVQADAVSFANYLNNVDVVTSCWTIHNIYGSQRLSLYGKIHSLLKAGGYFVNMDKYVPGVHSKVFNLPEVKKHFKNLDVLDSDLRKTAIEHERSDLFPQNVQTEKDLITMREVCGFIDPHVHERYGLDAIVSAYK